jgi:purine-binding chemotaxis protein CheW
MADLVSMGGGRHASQTRRGELSRGPVAEFLAFYLAGEVYAVPLTKIREILSPPPITEVPRAPAEVLGVCSVRGLLVTVLDLRRRLMVDVTQTTRRSRILLSEADDGEIVGLLVDGVDQVIRLAEEEVELASAALGGEVSEHVLGIGRPPGMEIILLDLSSVVPS